MAGIRQQIAENERKIAEIEAKLAARSNAKTVLSYGMGVDSTAILVRWLDEPLTRPCALENLVVVTAQTGNEFNDTRDLVEAHVLPRLRQHGVRFVELARSRDGSTTVFQDTRSPERLHTEGDYRLSDELEAAGTIPTSGGVHLCSLKTKAEPIERWLEANMPAGFTHVMGFNAGEQKRADRDVDARAKRDGLPAGYQVAFGFNADELKRAQRAETIRAEQGQAAPLFPLIEWGWDYAECERYIERTVGVAWRKSCCTFCPFAGGRAPIVARYQDDPNAAAEALMLEFVALALNPRMALYKTKTLADIVRQAGNDRALEIFDAALAKETWGLYLVRRIFTGKGTAQRSVVRLSTGDRRTIQAALAAQGQVTHEGGVARVHHVERDAEAQVFPAAEAFIVAAPARVREKTGRGDQVKALAKFDARFAELEGESPIELEVA